MSKMEAIRQTTSSQIKPILNSEQQAKYEQMMSRHGHHGGQGSQAPPPGAAPNQ
jgi:hypothetical protein